MPEHQQITAARNKAKLIREYATAFRRELRIQRVVRIHTKANSQDVALSVVQLLIRNKEAA